MEKIVNRLRLICLYVHTYTCVCGLCVLHEGETKCKLCFVYLQFFSGSTSWNQFVSAKTNTFPSSSFITNTHIPPPLPPTHYSTVGWSDFWSSKWELIMLVMQINLNEVLIILFEKRFQSLELGKNDLLDFLKLLKLKSNLQYVNLFIA